MELAELLDAEPAGLCLLPHLTSRPHIPPFAGPSAIPRPARPRLPSRGRALWDRSAEVADADESAVPRASDHHHAQPRRVRVRFNGKVVADTQRALTLAEASMPAVQYIPRADADMSAFVPTDHKTLPFKGDASYFTLEVDGKRAENAAGRTSSRTPRCRSSRATSPSTRTGSTPSKRLKRSAALRPSWGRFRAMRLPRRPAPPAARVHHQGCHLCEAIVRHRDHGREDGAHRRHPRRRGRPVQPRLHLPQGARRCTTCTTIPTACARRWSAPAAAASWSRSAGTRRSTWSRARLRAIQAEHGRDAVAVYQGNPTVHNYGAIAVRPAASCARCGTRNRFSATSVDQLPHMLAALLMFGHQLLLPVPDIDRTDYFLILGANPVGLERQPDDRARTSSGRLKAIRARGGQVVVHRSAPHRDRGARRRAPASSAPAPTRCCCSRCCTSLFAEELAGPGALAALADGLDELARARAPTFPPERVAAADRHRRRRRSARWRASFAARRRAVLLRPRRRLHAGVRRPRQLADQRRSTSSPATSTRRAARCSPRPRSTSSPLAARIGQRGSFGTLHAAACAGCPSSAASCPVAALAEEIETPGAGPDPRAASPSPATRCCRRRTARRLERALAGLDFMVVDRLLPQRDHAPRRT